jgi:hypothetical protein
MQENLKIDWGRDGRNLRSVKLLDQAVMKIGAERKRSRVKEELQSYISHYRKGQESISIQRVMNGIKPQMLRTQDDLLKEITIDIEQAIQNAREMIKPQPRKTDQETEEKHSMHDKSPS